MGSKRCQEWRQLQGTVRNLIRQNRLHIARELAVSGTGGFDRIDWSIAIAEALAQS